MPISNYMYKYLVSVSDLVLITECTEQKKEDYYENYLTGR